MFVKLNRLNAHREEAETLVKTEDIAGIFEKKQADKKLYDEFGNEVTSEKVESVYKVAFNNGHRIFVTKATYEALVKKLDKVETL